MEKENIPFHLTHQIRFYLPICDQNPYAAYLLAHCYNLLAISIYQYQEKQREEELRLMRMPEDERERETERLNDEGYDKYMDRLLNEHNGETFLNEEEDAIEGVDGIFDLSMISVQETILYESFFFSAIDEEALKNHLKNAYILLREKGFLKNVWIKKQLQTAEIEGALSACYPDLFEDQEELLTKAKRKAESKKVQYHLNMAKRLGLPATLTLPAWLETLNHFGWRCAYCQKNDYTILEHIQPIITGEGTTMENCVPACASCNATKRDTHPAFLPSEFGLQRIYDYFAARRSPLS